MANAKELLPHLGEVILLRGHHYEARNGKYKLEEISQVVKNADGGREWKTLIKISEPGNKNVCYTIDPKRYEITFGENITAEASESERIRLAQAKIYEKLKNC